MKIRKIRVQPTAWLQFATKELPTIPATIVTVFLQDKHWKINTSCSTFKPLQICLQYLHPCCFAVFATIKSILAGLKFALAGSSMTAHITVYMDRLKMFYFVVKVHTIILIFCWLIPLSKDFVRWKALPWCYVSKDVDCMFFLVFSIKTYSLGTLCGPYQYCFLGKEYKPRFVEALCTNFDLKVNGWDVLTILELYHMVLRLVRGEITGTTGKRDWKRTSSEDEDK